MNISFEDMRKTLDKAVQDEDRKPSHIMFEMLADWVDAIVWVGTTKGELLYVNRFWRELTDLDLEETKNLGWRDVIHPDDIEEVLRQREAQLQEGIPFYARYRVKNFQTGNYEWFRGKCVRFTQGRKPMWFGMSIPDEENDHEGF